MNAVYQKDIFVAAKLHRDSYALFPHMTVGENITFGLRLAGVAKDEIQKKLAEVANVLQQLVAGFSNARIGW